jgi:hypothetical protein
VNNEKDDLSSQQEDSRMNVYAAVTLVIAAPLFVMAFLGHEWAKIDLKVFLSTVVVLGSLLLFLERDSLKKRWLWLGMIPICLLHAAAMYGLVAANETFPQIDRFPVATYGLLLPAIALECGILYAILERFRPREGRG